MNFGDVGSLKPLGSVAGSEHTSPRRAFAKDCLVGSSILVTGASSGIGRATAVALAGAGARLILMGRDQARLEETVAMLSGAEHSQLASDIHDADQFTDVIKTAARDHGPFDGIFHAAGAFVVRPMKVTKQQHLDAAFNASVLGAYGISRAASQRGVINDGGSIVFMSSIAAERGHGALAAYAGAKAAVVAIARSMAIELAPKRIRVNAIVASTIETEMHLRTIANAAPEHVQNNEARHPLGFGKPSDIGNAALYLLSDASTWVTGTSLVVDGGYLA